MDYRGKQYTIAQEGAPDSWGWTVHLDEKTIESGVASSRAAATIRVIWPSLPARTCKWLLRMHDLVGVDLPLSQEYMAQMMAVRRTSVTEVAVELQKSGMITYSRGHIHINDVDPMRRSACECNEDLRSHHRRIFGSNEKARSVLDA